MIEEKLQTVFTTDVEDRIRNGHTCMDAVVDLCEEHNVEPAVAAKYLSKPLVEKLQSEGQDLNMLPRQTKLPFFT
tara:strand:- start:252 stop:476 length:225 start_codon:yes stop_codon:yes gene_type:complete